LLGGKTTRSEVWAEATEEVNKQLNNTKPKSFFTAKHRRFQNSGCETINNIRINNEA
jgi:hypothetical protein